MRESAVEKYLHDQVTAAGGTTRKFSSATRPNNPDRIVIWKRGGGQFMKETADVHFIECKAPGRKARPAQAREHERLRKLGCVVLVLDSFAKINVYVERNR